MSNQQLQLLAPMLNNAQPVFSISELDEAVIAATLATARQPIEHRPVARAPPSRKAKKTDDGDDVADEDFAPAQDDNAPARRQRRRRTSAPPPTPSTPAVGVVTPPSAPEPPPAPKVKVPRPRRTAPLHRTELVEFSPVRAVCDASCDSY